MMAKPKTGTRVLTTGVVVTIAVIACVVLYFRFMQRPWTRDAQVSADIIMVAPRVTGVVVEVSVVDNQFAKRDDPIFVIDPGDFELSVSSARIALDQARQQVAALEAAVVAAEASVREAEAGVTTANAQIESAHAQVTTAEGQVAAAEAGMTTAQATIDKSVAGLDQAKRDADRAAKLAKDGAGSVANAESQAAAVLKAKATLDGAHAGQLEAQASLDQARAGIRQARAGLTSAEAGVGEAEARLASAHAGLAQAVANLGARGEENTQIRNAKVDLAQAELDLERTTVRAPTDGYVTNLSVDVGDYASPGTPMLAFVDVGSFHVEGYFRETQLRHIAIGDVAVVTLMSHRGKPIEGTVESIGWAINPPDVATTEGTGGLVPQVQPSFDWIRLAQRVPVRIKLGPIPDGVQLASGTTASVAIKPKR